MRVLVVNDILIGDGSGTGNATENTLRNMFEGLENVQILQYSLAPEKETFECGLSYVSTILCNNNMLLGNLVAYTKRKILQNIKEKKRLESFWRKMNSVFSFVREIVPCWIPVKDFRQIGAFQPEVIYTLGADIRLFRMCRYLSDRLGIPIVVHNMDDFYNMKFTRRGKPNLIRSLAMQKLRSEYIKVYQRSIQSLAIGPKMKCEYENEFKIPFDWVMNCVDYEQDVVHVPNKDVKLIIFSGGLHMGRNEVLKKIAEQIENTRYKLEIYTSNSEVEKYKESFAQYENTKISAYVERQEMFNNISRADMLLHVESSKDEYIRYFRLSMSTKIPEYLISCKPIICVGSQEIGTVNFLKETGAAVICENAEEVVEAIDSITSIEERERLVAVGRKLIEVHFNKTEMQKRMYAVFCKNVEEYKR